MRDHKRLYEIIGRLYADVVDMSEREDGLINKHEAELKEEKGSKDFWWREYRKTKDYADGLEAELAEKDQMIAGFNHEHGRMMAEANREEQIGDDW